jgi:hypothetical protein
MNKPLKSTGRISEAGAVQKPSTVRQSRKFESRKPQQTDRYQKKRKEVTQTFNSPGGKAYAQMVE